MRENIIRFLYVLYGIWIGFLGVMIYDSSSALSFIIFIALGAALSSSIKEIYLDTELKEILGLVLGMIFCYPIAYVFQYVIAWVVFIFNIIKWCFQI